MANIYDLSDTWNAGATVFTAIKMNVTDTASASGSLLMDLQVGGVSRFSVAKGAGAIFAANLIEQRNGTTAQVFNIYNTYTDASNYERGVMKWTGNDLKIGTENAGTGSATRQTHLYGGGQIRLYTGNALRWYVDSGGNFVAGTDTAFDIGATASARPRNLFLGNYAQLSEMTAPAAPAANDVRIYAEDDGAGKTRLMARFATGAAVQIAIEP